VNIDAWVPCTINEARNELLLLCIEAFLHSRLFNKKVSNGLYLMNIIVKHYTSSSESAYWSNSNSFHIYMYSKDNDNDRQRQLFLGVK